MRQKRCKMVDECICRWKLLLIFMIVLCSFFVSALDITFLSPSDGDTVASAVTINATLGEAKENIQNVSIYIANTTINNVIYSTSSVLSHF